MVVKLIAKGDFGRKNAALRAPTKSADQKSSTICKSYFNEEPQKSGQLRRKPTAAKLILPTKKFDDLQKLF